MITLGNLPINVTLFPDKTSQVWQIKNLVPPRIPTFDVQWKFESEAEFLHLAQLKDLLDSCPSSRKKLTISYLPYARQDKPISNNSTFALHTFAKLLNTLNFDEVVIVDPHSEIALNLIQNSKAVYPTKIVENLIKKEKIDVICFPDKGAQTKYEKLYKFSNFSGQKVRNQLTGQIEKYTINGNVKKTNVLVVDDLCDGGATFILLAKELYNQGANSVSLFVTHGLFTKGVEILWEARIDKIFTIDSEFINKKEKIL